MSSEIGPDEAGISEFEESLRSLRPASRVSRDQILFQAGQRQAQIPVTQQPHWSAHGFWPAIAASLALVVLGQGILLARRPANEIKVVYMQSPPPGVPASHEQAAPAQLATETTSDFGPPGPTATDRLNWQLIRYGLDALPMTPITALAPSEKPLTAGRSLEIDIQKLSDPGGSL